MRIPRHPRGRGRRRRWLRDGDGGPARERLHVPAPERRRDRRPRPLDHRRPRRAARAVLGVAAVRGRPRVDARARRVRRRRRAQRAVDPRRRTLRPARAGADRRRAAGGVPGRRRACTPPAPARCSTRGTPGRGRSIHGDPHSGNLFLDGTTIGFLDWGMVSRSPGMRDVAYFCCNSLPTDVRRVAPGRAARPLPRDPRRRRRRARPGDGVGAVPAVLGVLVGVGGLDRVGRAAAGNRRPAPSRRWTARPRRSTISTRSARSTDRLESEEST